LRLFDEWIHTPAAAEVAPAVSTPLYKKKKRKRPKL